MTGKWKGAAAALALASGISAFAAPAQAQFFAGWGSQRFQIEDGLSPGEIRASLADQGYRLLGPLRRNGRVLLADVTDRRGRSLRLIVDPFEGEILQRFLKAEPGPARNVPGVAAVDPDDVDPPDARAAKPRPPVLGKPAPKVAVRSLPEKPRMVMPRQTPPAATRPAPAPETRAQAPAAAPSRPSAASVPAREAPAIATTPRVETAPAPRSGPGFVDGVPNAPLD